MIEAFAAEEYAAEKKAKLEEGERAPAHASLDDDAGGGGTAPLLLLWRPIVEALRDGLQRAAGASAGLQRAMAA